MEEPAPDPLLAPGRYVLDAPKAETSFIVYVPIDYSQERHWPVIFCYPGAGGKATVWPYFPSKKLLDWLKNAAAGE